MPTCKDIYVYTYTYNTLFDIETNPFILYYHIYGFTPNIFSTPKKIPYTLQKEEFEGKTFCYS